jgi:hypothetical protein
MILNSLLVTQPIIVPLLLLISSLLTSQPSHTFDDTISLFVIETKDEANHFNDFLSLGHGQRLCLTETNRQFHLSISRELGNSEVYSYILKGVEGDISIANVVDD